jgi:pyruvate,water dikinase
VGWSFGLHERSTGEDQVGRAIRRLLERAYFPEPIADSIGQAYRELRLRYHMAETDVAARSSATAEDLPEVPGG